MLRADDKGKKVTIKGDAMCAKCGLEGSQELPECRHRQEGRQGDQVLPGAERVSPRRPTRGLGICQASKDEPVKVEVTGTCEKKDDKLVLTPTEKIKKID